jgi:hypothetical protein
MGPQLSQATDGSGTPGAAAVCAVLPEARSSGIRLGSGQARKCVEVVLRCSRYWLMSSEEVLVLLVVVSTGAELSDPSRVEDECMCSTVSSPA